MSLKKSPEIGDITNAIHSAGYTGTVDAVLTYKTLISTLLYGTIFFLVGISFIFFYAHEFSRVKQGISTGIESVAKVFFTHIGLVFFLMMLFVILDILLPPDYKVSKAINLYFAGFGMQDLNIHDPWLGAMKFFEGQTPFPADKYYVSMIIYFSLLILYMLEVLTPFVLVLVTLTIYVKSYKDPMGSSTPMLNIAKAFGVYTLMVLFLLIHLKIGSAAIEHFTVYQYDFYSDMKKHLTMIFTK
jgi:hypothetical protein